MRGIFGRLVERRSSGDPTGWDVWSKLVGQMQQSKTGISVSLDSALRVAVVLACARVLAEGVAQVPLKLYRSDAGGRGKASAEDLRLYDVLHRRPNGWMTSFEFRETLTWHAVLCGAGYAVKNVVGGEVRELLPVVPGNLKVTQDPVTWRLVYDLRDAQGRSIGAFDQDLIFQVRGPSWDGFRGLDMLSQAREAIGLGMALEESHARLFSNGARPGGILSTDKPLDDAAVKRLRDGWQQQQEGVSRAFKTAVLDNGIKWQSMAMTGVDAQALEQRRFQIEEICRALRVFPLMIGHSDKAATFASALAFTQAHVTHSLGPWFERWEQALDRDVVPAGQGLFAKFSVQGLLFCDAKARADFYTKLYGIGVLNPNEIRELEELNPYDGGDQYRVPLNMADPNDDPADEPPPPPPPADPEEPPT